MNTVNRSHATLMDVPAPDRNPRIDLSGAPEPPVRLGRYAIIAVIVLVAAFVLGLLPRLQQRKAVAATTRELTLPTVTVVSPSPGKMQMPLSLPAEIRPLAEASIHARATGYVKAWFAELGSSVTNGQVLAELDTTDLNQELARDVAKVNEVQAGLELARTSAERWLEMRKTQAVSQQETDERAAELALKIAQLASARAEVLRLENLTSFAHVTAPFAGTVTARKLDIGQLVNANDGAELYRLAQTATLRVFVRVPQTLARSIAVGQTTALTFTELPNQHFPAKVVRTAGALDAASRTLLTELELPNPDGHILPGGYAQVRFPDAHPEPLLTVPSNTLLFRNDGPRVAVVNADGQVELRSVALGRDLGTSLEVLSGVSASDRIILNPADSLANGAQVHVVELKAAKG